jgi:DNA adenine methylase
MKGDERNRFAARPFLKWPGGKRWLIHRQGAAIPKGFNRYFEPFVGSGAVFFFIRPKRALLSDINPDVVDAYRGIKDDPFMVEELLERHADLHCSKYYYLVRSTSPRSTIARAARLIYLNRTCFNGVYRLNHGGMFNVPKGARDEVIFDDDNFSELARCLQHAELRCSDFETVIDEAKSFDFVFADPPYTVRHNVNGFVKYNEILFSWGDQVRLAKCLRRAVRRGARILCTNADHASIRELYSNGEFSLERVTRFSGISADPHSRNAFGELLIKSRNLYQQR